MNNMTVPVASSRRPISKRLFLDHFWWVYTRLQATADGDYTQAAYFRFMTLMGESQDPRLWGLRLRRVLRSTFK